MLVHHDLDAGGRPSPRVEGLSAQVPGDRSLDGAGPHQPGGKRRSIDSELDEADARPGKPRAAKCPTRRWSISSRTRSQTTPRTATRRRAVAELRAARRRPTRQLKDATRPKNAGAARASSQATGDEFVTRGQVSRRRAGVATRNSARPIWTWPAANTSWASATNCRKVQLGRPARARHRASSKRSTRRTIEVQDATAHRKRLEAIVGRDDRRRRPSRRSNWTS